MAASSSSETDYIRTQLCLVTPSTYEPQELAEKLRSATAGGEIASLIITSPTGEEDEQALQSAAEILVPAAQEAGIAVVIHNSTRVMGRSGADGVHMDGAIADLVEAAEKFAGKQIVGAGEITTRHDAMMIGEGPVDYLFFGRLDGDTKSDIFHKTQKLGAWWASMFEVPAIVMGGNAVESVKEAQGANIEFVALKDAVWQSQNPAEAVETANKLLDESFAELTASA